MLIFTGWHVKRLHNLVDFLSILMVTCVVAVARLVRIIIESGAL